MADTPHYGGLLPTVGADSGIWGGENNDLHTLWDQTLFETATQEPINAQTGSAYTLTLTDAGELVERDNASANTLTVPLNSSVAFPVKTRIDLVQYGAGQTTVVATGGVTIRSSGAKLKLTGQYSGASLYKRGTDEWVLIGDLSA